MMAHYLSALVMAAAPLVVAAHLQYKYNHQLSLSLMMIFHHQAKDILRYLTNCSRMNRLFLKCHILFPLETHPQLFLIAHQEMT